MGSVIGAASCDPYDEVLRDLGLDLSEEKYIVWAKLFYIMDVSRLMAVPCC
jgi:hypothetical protein